MTLQPGAAGPARCAGLRHALLNDWQRGFPIEGSPFQVVARRLGGTLREVLGHCHALSDEGSLDSIRVHWSACMERVRWRCGLWPGAASGAALPGALTALPGVTGWDWLEAADGADEGKPAAPPLWFDLVARHAAAARAQLAWLEARHGPVVRLELEGAADTAVECTCPLPDGPCSDPALARRCEAGLPLVAHPYRTLSESMRRSEREVMARLRQWQRAGQMQALGLGRPEHAESLITVAGLAGDAVDAPVRAALLARPGIVEVQGLPGHPAWPFALQITATGAPAQAAGLLERGLAACGLGGRARRLWRVRRLRVRAAPLLFADIADGTAADAAVPAGP